MAYEVVMSYHLHMPSYFLGTFTEYPYIELEKVRKAISHRLKDEILVTPKVKLVKKGSLPQSEGKAVRVKDLRDNK